jgi:hypothetical protein
MALVHGKSDGTLDFDAVVASLARQCPGTELLEGDYCATRIARLTEMCCALGEPAKNPVLERTIDASRKLGVTRQIRVPLQGDVELLGTVNQGGLLLTTKQPLRLATLAPVLAALAEFTTLQIKVRGVVSERIKHTKVMHAPEYPRCEIFLDADDDTSGGQPQPKNKPWWRFW